MLSLKFNFPQETFFYKYYLQKNLKKYKNG